MMGPESSNDASKVPLSQADKMLLDDQVISNAGIGQSLHALDPHSELLDYVAAPNLNKKQRHNLLRSFQLMTMTPIAVESSRLSSKELSAERESTRLSRGLTGLHAGSPQKEQPLFKGKQFLPLR